MARCKATTRSGNPCRNTALPHSDYCHINAHSQFKPSIRRRIFDSIRNHKRKLSIFASVSFVIAILGNISSISSVITGSTKQDIHSLKTEVVHNQQEMYNLLIKQFEINRDKLKTKYPLGYAIFYTDGKEIFAPNDARLQTIKLSWNNAKIIDYSDTKIVMRMPDFIYNGAQFINNTVDIQRKIGTSMIFLHSPTIQISVEILVDKGSYIVSVVGISQNKN